MIVSLHQKHEFNLNFKYMEMKIVCIDVCTGRKYISHISLSGELRVVNA